MSKLNPPEEVAFESTEVEDRLQPGVAGRDPEGFPPPISPTGQPPGPHGPLFQVRDPLEPTPGGTDLADAEEAEIICPDCEHFWEMRKFAAVKNRKPDGTPFQSVERYCLVVKRKPMDMGLRLVRECNKFQAKNQG